MCTCDKKFQNSEHCENLRNSLSDIIHPLGVCTSEYPLMFAQGRVLYDFISSKLAKI